MNEMTVDRLNRIVKASEELPLDASEDLRQQTESIKQNLDKIAEFGSLLFDREVEVTDIVTLLNAVKVWQDICRREGTLVADGNTYAAKDSLKAAGFRWNGTSWRAALADVEVTELPDTVTYNYR